MNQQLPEYVTERDVQCYDCKTNKCVKIYDMVQYTCYPCYVKRLERQTLEDIRRWGSE